MGMRSKNPSGDQTLQHSGTAEMPKPLSIRRQQPEKQSESLNCPRCSSTKTKFCYYNNYNKSQPRHFCKSCKRHWTKGGTLRNVPVGGGSKNKRPKASRAAGGVTATSAATASALRQQDLLSGGPSSPVMHETSEGVDNVTISGKPLVVDGDSAGLDTTAFQIIPNAEFQLSGLSTFEMDGQLRIISNVITSPEILILWRSRQSPPSISRAAATHRGQGRRAAARWRCPTTGTGTTSMF